MSDWLAVFALFCVFVSLVCGAIAGGLASWALAVNAFTVAVGMGTMVVFIVQRRSR